MTSLICPVPIVNTHRRLCFLAVTDYIYAMTENNDSLGSASEAV
jgi:TusA-related sulfurtransferase